MPILHVIPVNDEKTHIKSSTCSCGPSVKEESGSLIIVHNSFDGREAIEFAREQLNLPENDISDGWDTVYE